MAILLVCILEEKASNSKKPQMTSEEERYLCHVLTLQQCTPKQTLLCDVADSMYGKKFKDLPEKTCVTFAAGEAILLEKAILYLQKQMERLHYSVTQLAFNMGKLTGQCTYSCPF